MELHYKNILGGLTDNEAVVLNDAAEAAPVKRFLEVGTFCGRSASVLAHHAETLVCIDLFCKNQHFWGQDIIIKDTHQTFWDNLGNIGLAKKAITLKGNSKDILPTLGGRFGLIYIDGGHTMADVLPTAIWAWEHLFDGGMLCFHDYENKSWPDVATVVDCLMSKWKVKPMARSGMMLTIKKEIV
jgi:hypothetical protein